jgi:hypothetical protein
MRRDGIVSAALLILVQRLPFLCNPVLPAAIVKSQANNGMGTGRRINVPPGADLQAALNAADRETSSFFNLVFCHRNKV